MNDDSRRPKSHEPFMVPDQLFSPSEEIKHAVRRPAAEDIVCLGTDHGCVDRRLHGACVGRFNQAGATDRTVPAAGVVSVSMHDWGVQTDLANP